MLSFLIILLVNNVKSQTVCITGKIDDNNFNVGLNGLYSAEADYNGNSAYSKTTDCTALSEVHLYFVSNQWRIAETQGASSWIAYCAQTSIDDCTAGEWQVAGSNGFAADSNMYSQSGGCPSWPCSSVTTTLSTGSANCQSFDTKVAANTYKNSDNFYWYFNQVYQSWFCINGTAQDYTSCSVQFNAATSPGWTQATSGASVALTFDNNGATGLPDGNYDITCDSTGNNNNNTPAPTMSPVDSTGNNNNTPSPTMSPEDSTGNNPSPTMSPVDSTGGNNPSPTMSPQDNGGNAGNPTMSPEMGSGNNGNNGMSNSIQLISIYGMMISFIIAVFI